MKDVLFAVLKVAALVAVIVAGIYIKSWQCDELFPHASTTACLFWR